ncbi:MAG: hypothetical protein K8R89_00800 [Anaerolineae bacterium]|nr:hypothetical protein [Anaerolineae bacterium]
MNKKYTQYKQIGVVIVLALALAGLGQMALFLSPTTMVAQSDTVVELCVGDTPPFTDCEPFTTTCKDVFWEHDGGGYPSQAWAIHVLTGSVEVVATGSILASNIDYGAPESVYSAHATWRDSIVSDYIGSAHGIAFAAYVFSDSLDAIGHNYVVLESTWNKNSLSHGEHSAEICVSDFSPPPPNYCPDGIEAVTATTTISPSVEWTSTISTPYDRLKTRFIFSPTITLNADVSVNGIESTLYQSATTVITYTTPTYGVGGTMANLSVLNNDSNGLRLLSACVIPATAAEYCSDGIELLNDPISLTLTSIWQSANITTTYAYLAVRYRLENPSASALIYGLATVNGNSYSVNGGSADVYTVTVPGGLSGIAGPDVAAAYRTTGDPTLLSSACVIDRPPTRPRYCTYFYDFENDLEGWDVSPGVGANHNPDESNGAVRIIGDGDLNAVILSPLLEYGNWEMSAAVRSYGDDDADVTFGLRGAGWPFTDTYKSFSVGSSYETLQAAAMISGFVQIAARHTYIDRVCLTNLNDGLPGFTPLPIPDCGPRPVFTDHPDFSITAIGDWIHWLAQKLGEVLLWLVCILTALINTAFNWLLTQLHKLIELLPQVPENLFSLTGWIEWYKQLFSLASAWLWRQIVSYYTSIRNAIDWLSVAFYKVMEWLNDIFTLGLAWWIGHINAVISAVTGIDLLQIVQNSRIFIRALGDEISLEFHSFLQLFGSTYDVFAVLVTGYRGALFGDTKADFGQGMGGYAMYLWAGVEWVSDAIDDTPLTALNFVAMGLITWGLIGFTLGKGRKWIEKIAGLL